MSKMLATFLGETSPLFTMALQRLEQASGHTSADVRLTADIVAKSHQKMRELGLDPKDTTGEELYAALLELIKRHDSFLARKVGVSDTGDVQEALSGLYVFLQELDIQKSVWVLKHSVAKRMLKESPPRKVMKQLGYRSIDSMLKRESVNELYCALRFMESSEWLRSFTEKYRNKLSASDFETRPVEFLYFDSTKWGSTIEAYVRVKRHNVTHMKELGVVAILPLPMRQLQGIIIATLPLILHYVNEVRMYSAYFKLQQVRPHFGQVVAKTLLDDPHDHASLAGHNIHWRSVYKHFGMHGLSQASELFEPHVRTEDLLWRKAEETLYRIEPALHFWHDMDYVGARFDGQTVSFSLMDMAANYVNRLAFNAQSVQYFRMSLRAELYARYMHQPVLERQIVNQLQDEPFQADFADLVAGELFA